MRSRVRKGEVSPDRPAMAGKGEGAGTLPDDSEDDGAQGGDPRPTAKEKEKRRKEVPRPVGGCPARAS